MMQVRIARHRATCTPIFTLEFSQHFGYFLYANKGDTVFGSSDMVLQKENTVITTPKVAPVAQIPMAIAMTMNRLQYATPCLFLFARIAGYTFSRAENSNSATQARATGTSDVMIPQIGPPIMKKVSSAGDIK